MKSSIISCDGSYVFWLLDYETVHIPHEWGVFSSMNQDPPLPNPHSPKNYRGKVQATVNISKHGLAQPWCFNKKQGRNDPPNRGETTHGRNDSGQNDPRAKRLTGETTRDQT